MRHGGAVQQGGVVGLVGREGEGEQFDSAVEDVQPRPSTLVLP